MTSDDVRVTALRFELDALRDDVLACARSVRAELDEAERRVRADGVPSGTSSAVEAYQRAVGRLVGFTEALRLAGIGVEEARRDG